MASLGEMMASDNLVTLYGELVAGLATPATLPTFDANAANPFARIRGAKILEKCIRIPGSLVVLVPSPGTALQAPECDFPIGTLKWNLPFDLVTIALNPMQMKLLDAVQSKGAKITGGITFGKPYWQGTKICVDVRTWVNVDVDELFVHIHEHYDKTQHLCVDLVSSWIEVIGWTVGVVNVGLELQYRPFTELCGRIHVSVPFGIWDGYFPSPSGQCVTLPIKSEQELPAPECACH